MGRSHDVGDVVRFRTLNRDHIGIIVDQATIDEATWLDYSVAVYPRGALFHLTHFDVTFVRPSYLARYSLMGDLPAQHLVFLGGGRL